MPADDEAAEGGECAAGIGADLCRRVACGDERLHGVAEAHDLLESFRVGESLVNALAAGLEGDFLVAGFRGVRNGVVDGCLSLGWARTSTPRAIVAPVRICRRAGPLGSAVKAVLSLIIFLLSAAAFMRLATAASVMRRPEGALFVRRDGTASAVWAEGR